MDVKWLLRAGPSVEIGSAGPGISQLNIILATYLLLPPKGRLLGWESQRVIYFCRVPISYWYLLSTRDL